MSSSQHTLENLPKL